MLPQIVLLPVRAAFRPLTGPRASRRCAFGGYTAGMENDFSARYGPWALIAGGSQGLGAAFADLCAARGLNLLLVARRPGPLEETAGALRARHGVQVRTVPVDLADPGFLERIAAAAVGLEIGLLVCDASHSHTGRFLDADLDSYQRVLDTNCRAPLSLIHRFGGAMSGRGRGGIIVMSSLSAFWGSPYVAVYGATKAFLLNLSEALGRELGAFGVDVTVCTAGPILTPNYISSKPAGEGPSALEMQPKKVAAIALAALGRKPLVVPGALNRLARFFLGRCLSRRAAVSLMEKSTARMYAS
jgi:short-subunit dehydrogenase